MIVVDASVAVKWLWPEVGHTEAMDLLRADVGLIAPDILNLEVSGAVLRNHRRKILTESEARTALEHWSHLLESGVVQTVPNEDIFGAAVECAFLARHALADCLYVAVGRDQNATVVTADETLYERCEIVYDKIQLLAAPVAH